MFGDNHLLTVVVLVVGIFVLAFEVAMFVDVVRNDSLSDRDRMIWAVGMLLLHPFVAMYYFFTEYGKRP